MEEKEQQTHPCQTCGRNFVQETLQKHEPICKKAAAKKRKVFDSGKQRSAGSDIPLNDVRKVQQEIKKNQGQFKPPKTAWRERHEQFMTVVQSAKGVDYALKTGTPLPPPPKSAVPSDYIQCEYCGRNFSRSAADRHVPFCKEQHSRQKSRTPIGGNSNKNKGQARQSALPQQMNGHVKGMNRQGRANSTIAGNVNGQGNEGRNSRSVSAGRPIQSRVPVPPRRGISPMKRPAQMKR